MQKVYHYFIFFIVLISGGISAQTGIGTKTPDESSILDISSTSKGFLMPRMSTIERDLIFRPAKGLMIFNTKVNAIENNIGTKDRPNWVSGGNNGASLSRGEKGDQGIQGVAGNDGTDGETGSQGAAGVNGAKGDAGINGLDGPIGINGADGAIGLIGPNGIDGALGAKGAAGTNGIDGTNGDAGANGVDGVDGTNGVDGANGDTGANGVDGAAGTNGIDGTNGDTGANGVDGISGTNGVDGTNGVNGINGDTGANGVDGAAGTNGVDGANGDTGANGVDGAAGTNGIDGANGDTGANGVDGAAGTKGIDGIDGNNGAIGATGAKGDSGTLGETGSQGAQGIQGIAGTDGTDGEPGSQGAAGTDGVNGATGNDGSDGKNGINGSTGAIGETGASAYETWLSEGNIGNQTEFVTSLKGETGPQGLQGESASYSSIDDSENISTSSTSDVLMSGMSKSPEPGSYLVFFNSQYSISPANSSNVISTSQGIEDLNVVYNEINNLPVTEVSLPIAISTGVVFTPGVYYFNGALSLSGTIYLDAEGDSDAIFVFKTPGAFNTAASVEVVLQNNASASNIHWVAEGAIGLGANTIMFGNLISHGAAVSAGAGSELEGRMLSTGGAISFGPGTASLPSGTSSINFRTINTFVMFTATGGLGNTGASTYNGDLATGSGALTGFDDATVNGTVYPAGETTVVEETDGIATFSLYQNGVLIPNSSRIRTTTTNRADVALQAMATIAQGETIDVRWNIDAGTLSAKNRILTIIKAN
ncbi:ice-binding family protein [Maribacter sp. ACAM166]|uniref:ice-binding family protein n=1 Tax=Maribacter sp. ACAM166 TaxID=2508996 RepID=UPI0010FDE3F9|nr:ice-binding family protein [Maribacter sp. ACAM166]TLP80291.1 DUF3494 domain-containing protein [Maribacter sp. ACAM166]